MLQPVSYVSEDGLQIKAFREDGKPCYEGKSPSGDESPKNNFTTK